MERVHIHGIKSRRLYQLACILLYADYGPVALFMAVQMVILGLWLVNPMYDTFDSSRTYDAMRVVAPELAWAAWYIVIGLALLFFACFSHNHTARWLSAALVAATWYFCSAVFYYSNPPVLGVGVFLTNALAATWLLLRARGNRERMA